MLLPFLYYSEKGESRLPRSPISQIAPIVEYKSIVSKALSSNNELIEFLENNYGYSRSIIWLRALQWMGLLDPVELSYPFIGGLKSLEIKHLPLFEIIKKSNCSVEFKVCVSLFLSLLIPTPFRKIMLLSLKSKTLEELAGYLLEKGNVSERMIATQHMRAKKGSLTDLIFLLKLLFSSSVIRRGKKSDKGGMLAYLREQVRGEWRNHPCFGLVPSLGIDLVEAETFISGSIDGLIGKKVDSRASFSSKLSENSKNCLLFLLTEMKLAMPQMVLIYEDYYDFKRPYSE